jgi:hypothetical protein
MGARLCRPCTRKTCAKEILGDFDTHARVVDDPVPIVTGTDVTSACPRNPMQDTLDEYEWKVATGMNINYYLSQGFRVCSYAPGECVWMSRPMSASDVTCDVRP